MPEETRHPTPSTGASRTDFTTGEWDETSSPHIRAVGTSAVTERLIPEPARWSHTTVSLPLRAGPLSIYDVQVPAAISTEHFTQLTTQYVDLPPRAILSDGGQDVVAIHSCPVDRELPRLSLRDGVVRYVPCHFPRYFTATRGTLDDFLAARLKSKTRSTLRRKSRKLAKALGHPGELSVAEYRTPEQFDTWYQTARQVSRVTYQETLLKRGLPESPEFVAKAKDGAERGSFRGYLLFDHTQGQRPIAYLYCPIEAGDVMMYDHVGHDPEYDALSPGTALLLHVLGEAFKDPAVSVFDFTEGDGEHKRRFATDEQLCADVFFFRATNRYVPAALAHFGIDGAVRSAVQVLDRFNLKERIRTVLHGRS